MKLVRLLIATFAVSFIALPMAAQPQTSYLTLSGFVAGSGVLNGNHCETTVSINPGLPPANVLQVEIHGAEAPTLTFTPWDFLIESPNHAMANPRRIQTISSNANMEWWRGFANEFNGAFDSGVWTIYIDEHPQGCAFYDGTTRLEFLY